MGGRGVGMYEVFEVMVGRLGGLLGRLGGVWGEELRELNAELERLGREGISPGGAKVSASVGEGGIVAGPGKSHRLGGRGPLGGAEAMLAAPGGLGWSDEALSFLRIG